MKTVDQMVTEYAHLVIETGVVLYPGQSLFIKTGVGNYWFAQKLALVAYEKGAQLVKIEVDDYQLIASRLANQTLSEVEVVPQWSTAVDFEMMAKDWALIRIDNTEDRHYLDSIDSKKLTAYRSALSKAGELYMNSRMRHEHPWCVICVPGPVWAKQVLGPDATEEQLWHTVAPILKLDQNNPTAAWQKQNEMLVARGAKLDALKIKSLHFKSSITDLTIGFTSRSRWKGGGDPLPSGRWFMPNIPTEEIFTTPDYLTTEGYVTTTRPVAVMGSTVEEVRLVFKKGKVVSCSAKKGEDIMDQFLSIDEGASFIGEVALVDEESPIAKANLIFNSILYDENASCHIALGAGYPSCLADSHTLSSEKELLEAGCNQSLVHTDFMIGSKDLNIEATTESGEKILIMNQGRFVL